MGTASQTSGGSTIYYIRDNAGKLVSERLGSGGSAMAYYYLFDGLGSVVALTDSRGTAVNTYNYDPYGKITGSTGSTANVWGYTGGLLDSQTGLVKLGHRFYDPGTGRWTQLDPLGGGYVYVRNSPVNFADPRGLDDPYSQGAMQIGESTPMGDPTQGGGDPNQGATNLANGLIAIGGVTAIGAPPFGGAIVIAGAGFAAAGGGIYLGMAYCNYFGC